MNKHLIRRDKVKGKKQSLSVAILFNHTQEALIHLMAKIPSRLIYLALSFGCFICKNS